MSIAEYVKMLEDAVLVAHDRIDEIDHDGHCRRFNSLKAPCTCGLSKVSKQVSDAADAVKSTNLPKPAPKVEE